jgi:hypothetical protein
MQYTHAARNINHLIGYLGREEAVFFLSTALSALLHYRDLEHFLATRAVSPFGKASTSTDEACEEKLQALEAVTTVGDLQDLDLLQMR